MRRIAFFGLGLLVWTGALRAQHQEPPAPGTPQPFTLPSVTHYALPNGMDVRLVQYGDVPKTSVRLVVQTGNIDEAPSEVWLANLLGDLMEQGTTGRSAYELAVAAARMGGSVDVGVGMNQFTIGGDVLSEFAGEMASLIGDLALRPALPPSELPRLKKDMLRRLSIARTQPQQLALEKFLAVIYPAHPYGRVFPTADVIEGFTLAEVRRFYGDNLGASRSTLYVVGRFDEAEVRKAVGGTFESWKRGTPPTRVDAKPHTERAVHLVNRPGAVQSTIYLGNPAIPPQDPDYLPLLVTNALLDGYFSSRVTTNLREEKGVHLLAVQHGLVAARHLVLRAGRRCHHQGDRSLPERSLFRDRSAAGDAPGRRGAARSAELSLGHLRAAELFAGGHHQPARVRRSARARPRLPPQLRAARQRAEAPRHPGDGAEVPPR
jgi:hypothetical protein